MARAVSSRLLTFSERKAVVLHLDEALIMLQAIKVLVDFTLLRTEVITQQWTLRQQTRTKVNTKRIHSRWHCLLFIFYNGVEMHWWGVLAKSEI